MHLQHRMTFLPPGAKVISEHLAFAKEDGWVVFFNASGPILRFPQGDETQLRFVGVVLSDPRLDLARPAEIARALGRHRNRIHVYRRRYERSGLESLEPKKRGPKGASKLTESVLQKAQDHLREGYSNRRIADLLGVSDFAIRKAIKDGRLHRPMPQGLPTEAQDEASTPRERTELDAACAGGIAVKRDEDRLLAQLGKLPEALPEFEPAESVAKAGVLLALPAVLGQGLVEVGQRVYGSLRNGYFGLSSVLLSFVFMALLRIKSIEGLTKHAPGEFGCVLGLDRAPEMKTARRKLAELAARGKALEFAGGFAERWAFENPDALGYLYVDGHVRPYHGRTHKLPKTFVQSRRLCMPATTDYWVNDANAQPLLFITSEANEGLLAMMEREVLPGIRRLAGDGRRVTVIFDREGWSPKRFKTWHKSDFDVLTYRKGKYSAWSQSCFQKVEVEVHGRKVEYLLAERMVRVTKGFRMREVRRLCENGHQTSILTTRQDLTVEMVAVRMFSRWQQENFFRYMRQEFALDHLPSTDVEPADPDRTVPNPVLKAKNKELARVKSMLKQAEGAYGQEAYDNREKQRPTVRGFKITHAELGREIQRLRATCDQLKAQIKSLPARVRLGSLGGEDPPVRLERERKTITDTLKMVAYRSETQLANLVGPLLPSRADEARKFMQEVFELPADLIPNYEQGTLLVRLHSMANPRSNRTLEAVCEVLNTLETRYPNTELRLVFEAPAHS